MTLAQNLNDADQVSDNIKSTIDAHIAENGIDAPLEARYVPVWRPEQEVRDVDYTAANITSVIWSTGFTANYRWIDLPAFDGTGYPTHRRGETAVPGLFMLGLPRLYTWGSGRFSGVARDANYLAEHIATRVVGPSLTGAAT